MKTSEVKINQRDLLWIIHQELKDLPPLPTVVVHAMQTVTDPKSSAADLNRLICMDPALSAKVLRLVNSAQYGFSSQVTTITHAIVILGFDTVRNLVTGLGAANYFKPSARQLLNREQFWAHSAATALAAEVIAQRRKLGAKFGEQVFVGGLLHDLGKLFLDQYFVEQYRITLQLAVAGNIGMTRAETIALGINHTEVGNRIANNWRLPPAPEAMITWHHEPQAADKFFDYAACVHVADIIVKQLKLGNSGDNNAVPALDSEVERWLDFSPSDWDFVSAQTMLKFEQAKELVSALGH